MIYSSYLESSLREAIPVFERFASLCFRAFVYGKGDEAGVKEDTLICEDLAACPELVNSRLLWKFEHFLATYLLDLSLHA